jgi:hypothetical protein
MLKKHIIHYSIGILSASILFILLGVLSIKLFNNLNCSKNYLSLILLFLPVSAIFHFILIYLVEKKPKKFVSTFLILTILKILIYLIVLVTFIFNTGSGIKCFLVLFLIFYLGYTLYEVIMLNLFLKNSRVR